MEISINKCIDVCDLLGVTVGDIVELIDKEWDWESAVHHAYDCGHVSDDDLFNMMDKEETEQLEDIDNDDLIEEIGARISNNGELRLRLVNETSLKELDRFTAIDNDPVAVTEAFNKLDTTDQIKAIKAMADILFNL